MMVGGGAEEEKEVEEEIGGGRGVRGSARDIRTGGHLLSLSKH